MLREGTSFAVPAVSNTLDTLRGIGAAHGWCAVATARRPSNHAVDLEAGGASTLRREVSDLQIDVLPLSGRGGGRRRGCRLRDHIRHGLLRSDLLPGDRGADRLGDTSGLHLDGLSNEAGHA